MTDTYTEIQAPPDGPLPIRDTEPLRRRIGALDSERHERLGHAWVAQGLGKIEPLVTTEAYKKMEELVAGYEPGATGDEAWNRMNACAEALYTLPEHIQAPCAEALDVYAGMPNPRALTITSWGRIAEMERIVGEAVSYAASMTEVSVPSVTDLPPVDDTREQVISEDYPGTKADAKTVEAWVRAGATTTDILNRAAQAYALEQDRSTVRKGLSAKLVEILGPDGLAQVNAALEAAKPPAMDLGGGPSAAEDESGEGASAGQAPDASVEGSPTPDVEAAPSPPSTEVRYVEMPSLIRREAVERLEGLHRALADAFAELAEVI